MANLDLEVQMGAKLADLEQGMDDAVGMAERAVTEIERRFSDLNPSLGPGIGVFVAGASSALAGILAFAEKMNSELADMDRNAREVGLTLEKFQGVKFAGAVTGLEDSKFVDGLQKAVGLLNDAQRNTNTLGELFSANGLKITANNGKLIGTNELLLRSADLVQRAATGQDKIKIAQLLGFTREWVPVLEQGANAFERQSQEAQRLGLVIDGETIQKAVEFDREWKSSAAYWATNMKAAAAEILPHINGLIDAASKLFTRENIRQFAQNGLDMLGAAGIPQQGEIEIPQNVVNYLQKLKDGIREATGAEITLFRKPRDQEVNESIDEGSGAGLVRNPTRIAVNKPPTIIPPKRQETEGGGRDPFEASIDQANRRIAILNAETATIGQNSEARERARLVAVLEEAAKRANSDAGLENTAVTAEQRKQIDELALAMENAARQNRIMAEALNNFRELGSAASEAFKGLVLEGKKFDDVLKQLLNRLASRAIDSAFNSLFGGLGGLFGGLFSGGGGGSWSGPFNPTGGALSFGGPRASGGPVSPGNWYKVGENGEEAFAPTQPGVIIPNDVLRGTGGVSAPVSISIDARGADEAGLSRLQTQLSKLEASIPQRVVMAVREARSANVKI